MSIALSAFEEYLLLAFFLLLLVTAAFVFWLILEHFRLKQIEREKRLRALRKQYSKRNEDEGKIKTDFLEIFKEEK